MDKDEKRLEALITLSDNVELTYQKDPFGWKNQRRLVFDIAKTMFLHYDMEAEDAVRKAREFVDTFHRLEVKHNG